MAARTTEERAAEKTARQEKLSRALKSSNQMRRRQETIITEPAETEKSVQQRAYESRIDPAMIADVKMKHELAQHSLLSEIFSFVDIYKLERNPKNNYTIDEKGIEGLAWSIKENEITTPIIVREVENTDPDTRAENPVIMQIVDGERRTLAHRYLHEQTGDPAWTQIPCRYFRLGTLSDSAAEVVMHCQNLYQRDMPQAERALAVAALAEQIRFDKRFNPASQYQGQTTYEVLAKQVGVKPRTIATYVNVGKKLVPAGMEMLKAGDIGIHAADLIAGLDEGDQEDILSMLEAGTLQKQDIPSEVKRRKTTAIPGAEVTKHLKLAYRHLRKAYRLNSGDRRALTKDWYDVFEGMIAEFSPDNGDAPATIALD